MTSLKNSQKTFNGKELSCFKKDRISLLKTSVKLYYKTSGIYRRSVIIIRDKVTVQNNDASKPGNRV